MTCVSLPSYHSSVEAQAACDYLSIELPAKQVEAVDDDALLLLLLLLRSLLLRSLLLEIFERTSEDLLRSEQRSASAALLTSVLSSS